MEEEAGNVGVISCETEPTIAGFEEGWWPGAKECGQLVEAKESKEMDSSLEAPRFSPGALILAQ